MSKEYRYQRLLYQAFVNEMKEMVCSVELSLDINRLGSSFCETCDPRVSLFVNRPLGNDSLLDRQMRFEPVTDSVSGLVTHGLWTIYRFYRAGFKHFPDCRSLAKDTATKLVKKLASLGSQGKLSTGVGGHSYSAREVTFKVQSSFFKGRVRWADSEDLSAKVTFIPQLAHVNKNSSSTKIRLCIVPNRNVFVNKELGFRSYNSFIRKNSLHLPSFLRFSLASALSIENLYLDIEDAYGCLKNSLADARNSIVFCLKSKAGLPSYDLHQCPDGILYPLIQASSSFGQADVSRLSQLALSQIASVYREHCSDKEVEDDVLDDVHRILTSLSYADDSQIPALGPRVIEWCQRRGRTPPRPLCSCTDKCVSWSCESLHITSSDLKAYDLFMQSEAKNYLCSVAHGFVKIANFSSHKVKFIRATNPATQAMLDGAGVTDNQSPLLSEAEYDVIRPSPAQVQAEVEKGAPFAEDDEEAVMEADDEAASQLGKVYVGDQVYLKTQKLYVCYFVGKSKRKTPSFGSYDELRGFCESKNIRISKVSISSICGQFWDPAGRHLGVARSCIKNAARVHLLDGPKSWHEPVTERVCVMFWKSVTAYFLTCRLPQPRSNLLLFPAAKFLLLCGSDAGEHMQSNVLTLLSYMSVDGKHVGRAHHLQTSCFSNHIAISQNIPLVELVSFHKLLVAATQALIDLKSFGIVIPPSACVLCVDSLTVLVQIRTKAHMYKKRIASLISRIQLLMAQHNLSPFDVVWLDQKSLPLGARYHADILSKSRQDKATHESILRDHCDLNSMSWIEEHPPHEWKWCHSDIGVPRLEDRELLHDLGVDEDHLQQVKEFLEKPTITSLAAFTAVAESGATPLHGGPGGVDRDHGTLGVVSDPDHPDEGVETGSEQGLGDAVGPLGDAALVSDVLDDGALGGITFDDCWIKQLSDLTLRKHSHGLGSKSIVSILAHVFQFVCKLKGRLRRTGRRLSPPPRLSWPSSLKPWCGEHLCGLHPGRGCGSPHPRLYEHNGFDTSTLPVIYPRKNDSHFLFKRQSLVGYNLGCPVALAAVEGKMKSVGGDGVAGLVHFELRVLAFDYLCVVNSGHFKVRGFEVALLGSLWGSRAVALGRRQRDWVKCEDTVPRLRLLDKSTAFASLCISAAHASSMGESPELSKLYLVSLRIMLDSEARLLKEAQQDCHACNLYRARQQRDDTKMRSHHLGPSGRISALGTYPPGLSCSQLDLIGPLSFLDKMANRVTLYLLICVSHTWGVTRLLPIRSKSTESVMLGLKTLALQQSTRFELVASDDGGEFWNTSNTFAPMHEEPGNALTKKWFDAFRKESKQIELQGLGIFVKFGKSRNCASVERRVADVKAIFRRFHLFAQDSEPTDIHEVLYLCALAEHVIHSRPVLVYGNQVYSLNTLRSLMMDAGHLATEADGIEPIGSGRRMRGKVKKICTRLSQLRTQMTQLMISFHLDTLLDNVHRRERVKHSFAVEDLNIGDVVFDSVGFRQTGHVTGSLARVIGQSLSKNHLLISKAALKSKGQLFKQICVSRPSNELHFVCKGTSEPVAVGETDTFNLLQYLPDAAPLSVAWELPAAVPPVDTDPASVEPGTSVQPNAHVTRGPVDVVPLSRQSSSQVESCGSVGRHEQTSAASPASDECVKKKDSQTKPSSVTTRAGRKIRRPRRYDV